jgi:hypothetical protein
MPQMHSTTHLGYVPVISPTGVACLCSTAAPAPPGLIPCSFGSQPQNLPITGFCSRAVPPRYSRPYGGRGPPVPAVPKTRRATSSKPQYSNLGMFGDLT